MSIVLQNFFHYYGIFSIFSRICFANWAVFLRSFPCYVVPTSLKVKCHQQYKDCRNEQYSCQHDCQDHRNGEKSRLSLWKVNNSEFLPFETRSACHGHLFETRWMREERVGEKIRKIKTTTTMTMTTTTSKKQLVLLAKLLLCKFITLLSTFLWGPLYDYDVKPSSFFYFNMDKALNNSTPGKFVYIWRIERFQNDSIKVKRTKINFLVMFSPPSSSLFLKFRNK